jgi:glycosyltransferase involved in cell wall biosynthesis
MFDIMPEQAELLDFIQAGGFVARAWRWFNRLWYQRASYTVVLSQDMLEGAMKNSNLLKTTDEMEARAKTHVIHVWSDDRLITPRAKSQSSEAKRLGVQERFVVQYSGNHGRFHDLETLLAAALSFKLEDGFVFQFIGEGQKKKNIEQRLAAARLPHLYCATYVPKDLLADSLAMSDLGVIAQMPGQERVCFPSKLFGIMAAGRPTLAICPPQCELGRLIREHGLGFVVANGDVGGVRNVLLEAQADPQRLRRQGENAFRFLHQHFTLSQAADSYFELLGGGRKPIGAKHDCGSNSLQLTHGEKPIADGQLSAPNSIG